ncbi:hypothetical protein Glove_296g62 [Diversispora epigaea]|uniref:V-SNARE coiled-coil homology domain-containing protein n=1 Tax=Diversispora epigaea TaxID=1348612 RepID=A0A397HZM6_9GLOM|nr:hypothetical protein Glove_296g62 [Diversispora epigaea]
MYLSDNVKQITQKIESTKSEIHKSLKDLADRGEKLDVLKEQTKNLASSSDVFKKQTRDTQKKMWWKNAKMTVILSVVCIIILALIIIPLILKLQNKI